MAVSDQMDMALAESGRQDPVSGNDVPMGSLPEEVRDDVPAMLSEGEYVVPADVLRFYGLKFFEDLRENAKMEITRMADEGRIGGEPVAGPGPTAPTPDQPNGLDLSPEDMQQLESVLQASEGGAVGFNVGGLEQGLDQSEQGGVPTQKTSMNMEGDAKTDQLIERIMSSVQKNPALQQKLAAEGVGFMKGGVVQGYAHGGAHTRVEDAISAQNKYATKKFNPFDPNWMLGMSASGLQDPLAGQAYGQTPEPVTADVLQEEAGVIKPQPEGDGGENNPHNAPMGPTYSKSTPEAQASYKSKAQSMIDYKGPFSIAVNALGQYNMDYADKQDSQNPNNPNNSTVESTESISDISKGSVSSGSSGLPGGKSSVGGGGGGQSNTVDPGDKDFMGKGGFISRRKKT